MSQKTQSTTIWEWKTTRILPDLKNYLKDQNVSDKIVSVGDQAEIVTNEKGGMQSRLEVRLDLIPTKPLLREGVVFAKGADRYAPWNWLKIDSDDHINHALVHLALHLDGDTSEDHLAHAACRVHMAMETHSREDIKERELNDMQYPAELVDLQ